MIVPPFMRLVLLVLAGIVPRWQNFFATSTDYSLRGLAMPIIDSIGIACVIVIARTRNPLVDGEGPVKTEITNTAKNPVPTAEAGAKQPAKPKP